MNNPFLSQFAGLQFANGSWYQARGGLAGDSDIMMISGVSLPTDKNAMAAAAQAKLREAQAQGQAYVQPKPAVVEALSQPVTLFGATLPVWAWLLIAAALGGFVGYSVGKKTA